jgi:hypothetical protein
MILNWSDTAIVSVSLLVVLTGVGCVNESGTPTPAPTPSTSESPVRADVPTPPSVAGPAPSAPAGAPSSGAPQELVAKPAPAVPTGCWDADVELASDACASPHQHIATALNACWAKSGEAVTFALTTACEIGGFRGAKYRCCPAPLQAVAPPPTLPEPVGGEGGRACAGGSSTGSGRETCYGPLSSSLVETVKNFAASGMEVRSFSASEPCADGNYATVGFQTCSPGFVP